MYTIDFTQLNSKSSEIPKNIVKSSLVGHSKDNLCKRVLKLVPAESFAENPLANVDLMSLYDMLLPLICKCIWQMVYPNMLLSAVGMLVLYCFLFLPPTELTDTYTHTYKGMFGKLHATGQGSSNAVCLRLVYNRRKRGICV